MKPVRILYVSGGSLDYGGITTVMLHYASRFRRDRVAVDFLVHGPNPGPREQEALALGAKVLHVPYKARDYFGNRKALFTAFREGGYDGVHAHMDGMNGYVLGLAKAAGVRERISHCHNTRFLTTNPLRVMLHRRTADRIPGVATRLLACSEAAGRFLYGTHPFSVVHNAISLERYRFDPAARTALRGELGVGEDEFAIGCVGRYDYQKNQGFLIDAFAQAVKQGGNGKLLLIGDGGDRQALEAQAENLGVAGRTLFTGYRGDVDKLLSALDLFALPSRFEGLGIVLIEAQAAGLPCVASTEVPEDTRVTDCAYLPLSQPERWVAFLREAAPGKNREVSMEPFAEAGYDIRREASKLETWYMELFQ